MVQNVYPASKGFVDFQAIKTGCFPFIPATDGKYSTWFQRITSKAPAAMQFRSGNKFFHSFATNLITEMRGSKFRRSMRFCYSLTRRLASNATLTAHSNSSSGTSISSPGYRSFNKPLMVLCAAFSSLPDSAVQSADGFEAWQHGSAYVVDSSILKEHRSPNRSGQSVLLYKFSAHPARANTNGCDPYLNRQGSKQVADTLLMTNIHVEIANHHNTAVSTNTLLPAAEFARLHVVLHDDQPIFFIKRHPSNLIKTDHVILANQIALPCGIIYEHLLHSCFAAGNQMRIRRHLLEISQARRHKKR